MGDSESDMRLKAEMARAHVDCTDCKKIKTAPVCALCWGEYCENKNKKDKGLYMDRLIAWIGDGNYISGLNIVAEIAQELRRQRTTNGCFFAEHPAQGFEKLQAKLDELRIEVFVTDDKDKAHEKCLELIGLAVRFLEGEYCAVPKQKGAME